MYGGKSISSDPPLQLCDLKDKLVGLRILHFDCLIDSPFLQSHVGISYTRLFMETCRQTNLAGTRASPQNRVANTKIIFVLAR